MPFLFMQLLLVTLYFTRLMLVESPQTNSFRKTAIMRLGSYLSSIRDHRTETPAKQCTDRV
jgi:hypothetical protein